MSKRSPLPPELRGVVFTRQQALMHGVPDRRLAASDLVRLDRGLIGPADLDPTELARATALRYPARQLWLSHESAARHYGFFLPTRADAALHLSVPSGSGRRRTAPVRTHEVRALRGEVRDVGAVTGAPRNLTGWITSRARTWLDLGASLDLDSLIVVGDQLVRPPRDGGSPLATRRELEALCDAHPRARGAGKARQALEEVRPGADSPPETKLRLALMRAGLPEPELQISPCPENPYAPRGDMGYRQLKLVLQYEGGHHRTAEQFSRDLDRDREWASYGWSSLRYDVSDLRNEFVRAVVEVDHVFRTNRRQF